MAALRKRFWAKVDKRGPKKPHMKTRCWVWTASMVKGYGVLGVSGSTTMLAHRISWKMHFKRIPNGKMVLHKCDVRACIRPSHLYVGTSQDNANDRVQRGLAVGGGAKGERCHLAKLTAEQVLYIRLANLSGPVLARMFGVTHQAIYAIKSKETWKHVV